MTEHSRKLKEAKEIEAERIRLEKERDFALDAVNEAKKDWMKERILDGIRAQESPTSNDLIRAQMETPAERGGRLLNRMMDTHRRTLEKQQKK